MERTERTIQGVHVVALSGEADLTAVPELQRRTRELSAQEIPALLIDFADVTFVNTPIWAVVVECYQKSQQTGAGFAISGMTEGVQASFDIVRLGEFIAHYKTEAEATSALAAS